MYKDFEISISSKKTTQNKGFRRIAPTETVNKDLRNWVKQMNAKPNIGVADMTEEWANRIVVMIKCLRGDMD